jgi:hypothetical protein
MISLLSSSAETLPIEPSPTGLRRESSPVIACLYRNSSPLQAKRAGQKSAERKLRRGASSREGS